MRHFKNLQAMRAVAALMVWFMHSFSIPTDIGVYPFSSKLWTYLPAGVDIFFVISGFIIATVACATVERNDWDSNITLARDFIVKRAIRIYPIYWIVIAIAWSLSSSIFLTHTEFALADRPLWNTIFLLDQRNALVQVAWSLAFEVYFYLIVGIILLVSPRHVYRALAVWAAVTLALCFYGKITVAPWRNAIPVNPLLMEFMAGVVISFLVRHNKVFAPVTFLSAGIILFAIGGQYNKYYGDYEVWARTIGFGPASAMLIYAAIGLEMKYKIVAQRFLVGVGDASYSIYIWHQTIIFSLYQVAVNTGLAGKVPGFVLCAVWGTIALCVGLFSYFVIEKPSLKFLWKLYKSGPTMAIAKPAFVTAIVIGAAFAVFNYVSNQFRDARFNQNLKLAQDGGKLAGFGGAQLMGDPTLPAATPVHMGDRNGKEALVLEISSASPSQLYIGFNTGVLLREKWEPLKQGENRVVLVVPPRVSGNDVYIAKDKPDSAIKVTDSYLVPL